MVLCTAQMWCVSIRGKEGEKNILHFADASNVLRWNTMNSLEIRKNTLHLLKKGVKSLDATWTQRDLATGTGCVSPWKCICVNERMWAFPQIDLWASLCFKISAPPLPSHMCRQCIWWWEHVIQHSTAFTFWLPFTNRQSFQHKKTNLQWQRRPKQNLTFLMHFLDIPFIAVVNS